MLELKPEVTPNLPKITIKVKFISGHKPVSVHLIHSRDMRTFP